jgi:hypothetical protein
MRLASPVRVKREAAFGEYYPSALSLRLVPVAQSFFQEVSCFELFQDCSVSLEPLRLLHFGSVRQKRTQSLKKGSGA